MFRHWVFPENAETLNCAFEICGTGDVYKDTVFDAKNLDTETHG